jgi:FK506-binding nuclear protein
LLQNYQQTLDIVIGEGEKVYFVVSGTHTVYLTGNYVVPEHEHSDDDDSDDEDYDLPPGMDDLGDDDSDDMSDELDGTRVKEIDTDEEEEAPKLVETKKGKNKRPAEEEAESLDAIIEKEEKKLSKKQLKKLKNNKGEAIVSGESKTPAKETAAKDSPASAKSDKKVQFAKELEQGPTGSAKQTEKKAAGGVKVVQGVTIDDRKPGTGRTVKSGDKVGMRYIGKLQNGKVFDCKSCIQSHI